MNYYIKGDKERAEEIKAAFEKKGAELPIRRSCADYGLIYFLLDGEVFSITIKAIELFEKNPDYKELELSVEPKFKVGDWIAYNENKSSITPMQIIRITEDRYVVSGGWSYDFRTLESDWHLWTIKDVKDGDVLVTEDYIFILKYILHGGVHLYCHYNIDDEEFDSDIPDAIIGNIHDKGAHFHPATKEQRGLLFAKLKEAGYTWDEKKKELKKFKLHYDIENFHAGMPVLQRSGNDEHWDYNIFSRYLNNNCSHPFILVGCHSRQCVPFNDDTKHLLGTTDMCDEYYINW